MHEVGNFDNFKNILKNEEIIPLCSNEKGIGNWLEKDETCGEYNVENILEELKKFSTELSFNEADHFSYVNCIFDPKKISTEWKLSPYYLIIDPEMLEKNRNKHIHMTLIWNYGKINNNTIIYNKYISPLDNLDTLYRFYKSKNKVSKYNPDRQYPNDIEIVSKSFDLKDCIIGVIYNKTTLKKLNRKDELIKIEKIKEEYPDKLWFSSMKEFKDFF